MGKVVIAKVLSGGDPRSLGRTEDVVRLVLRSPRRIGELFECQFVDDEVVRMRASDALEKVCQARPDLLEPFTRRLLDEVATIDQPSVQWHLAQILAALPLAGSDRRRAIAVLKRNLARSDDWIVINLTLEALASFAQTSPKLRKTLVNLLREYVHDPRKSVAKRANKLLAVLAD